VKGEGFEVYGFRFRVLGFGFWVFRVQGLGSRIYNLEFKV
jgi:hypothetical protein